jgi:hypothetical protein
MNTIFYILEILFVLFIFGVFLKRFKSQYPILNALGVIFYLSLLLLVLPNDAALRDFGFSVLTSFKAFDTYVRFLPSVGLCLLGALLGVYILANIDTATLKKVKTIWRLPLIGALAAPLLPEPIFAFYIYCSAIGIMAITSLIRKAKLSKTLVFSFIILMLMIFFGQNKIYLFHVYLLVHIIFIMRVFNRLFGMIEIKKEAQS